MYLVLFTSIFQSLPAFPFRNFYAEKNTLINRGITTFIMLLLSVSVCHASPVVPNKLNASLWASGYFKNQHTILTPVLNITQPSSQDHSPYLSQIQHTLSHLAPLTRLIHYAKTSAVTPMTIEQESVELFVLTYQTADHVAEQLSPLYPFVQFQSMSPQSLMVKGQSSTIQSLQSHVALLDKALPEINVVIKLAPNNVFLQSSSTSGQALQTQLPTTSSKAQASTMTLTPVLLQYGGLLCHIQIQDSSGNIIYNNKGLRLSAGKPYYLQYTNQKTPLIITLTPAHWPKAKGFIS